MQENGLPSKSRTALLMINFDAKNLFRNVVSKQREKKGRNVAK